MTDKFTPHTLTPDELRAWIAGEIAKQETSLARHLELADHLNAEVRAGSRTFAVSKSRNLQVLRLALQALDR